MRNMLVGVAGSAEWAQALPTHTLIDRDAPNFVKSVSGADDPASRMQGFLDEWSSFDPDYRRTSRLLGVFITWNIFAIGVSLIGFAFVHRLAWLSAPVFGLWFLTLGTVLATAIMVMEMRGSFVAWVGHVSWLEN